MKAWLVARDIPFAKTHDLERLLKMDGETDGLDSLAEAARLLTPYATEFRYPGDVFEPEPSECDEAIAMAAGIIEQIVEMVDGLSDE